MWKYVKAAFWARPEIPVLGRVPLNAIAFLGLMILGFGHEAFWLLGLGLEAAYLAALVSNARFRNLISSAESLAYPLPTQAADSPLTPPRRQRHDQLRRCHDRVLALYKRSGTDEILAEANLDALRRLATMHLDLLRHQQHVASLQEEDLEPELRQRITSLERDLEDGHLSAALRESKSATLDILRRRLANADYREQTLSEIESDLARIEAQFELAVDNAGMSGQPEAITSNISLVSRMLESPPPRGPLLE